MPTVNTSVSVVCLCSISEYCGRGQHLNHILRWLGKYLYISSAVWRLLSLQAADSWKGGKVVWSPGLLLGQCKAEGLGRCEAVTMQNGFYDTANGISKATYILRPCCQDSERLTFNLMTGQQSYVLEYLSDFAVSWFISAREGGRQQNMPSNRTCLGSGSG